jgi:hypothetical protein
MAASSLLFIAASLLFAAALCIDRGIIATRKV